MLARVKAAKQRYNDWYDENLAFAYALAIFQGRRAFRDATRGQTNMVGLFIGLLVAVIVVVNVFIPVVFDAINELGTDVEGTTTETILELLPLFAALLLLIALAAPLMRRM